MDFIDRDILRNVESHYNNFLSRATTFWVIIMSRVTSYTETEVHEHNGDLPPAGTVRASVAFSLRSGSGVLHKWSALCVSMAMVVSLAGCSSGPELRPEARDIEVRNQETPDLDKYELIGTASCERGMNFRSPSTNITGCRNKLRNKAARRGADLIVIIGNSVGAGGVVTEHGVVDCRNCVDMVGELYRRRTEVASYLAAEEQGSSDTSDDEPHAQEREDSVSSARSRVETCRINRTCVGHDDCLSQYFCDTNTQRCIDTECWEDVILDVSANLADDVNARADDVVALQLELDEGLAREDDAGTVEEDDDSSMDAVDSISSRHGESSEESGTDDDGEATDRAAKLMQQTTFSLDEAAEICGVSPDIVEGWINDGLLNAVNLGEEYRISRSELENTWRELGGGTLFAD